MDLIEGPKNNHNQILEMGHSYVVIHEIISIVDFGFRRWVGILGFFFTLLLSLVAVSLMLPVNPDLNFYLFAIIIFAGTILSLMLFQKTQEITTTGGKKHLSASYEVVARKFLSRTPVGQRITYKKKNLLHSWQFVIHTAQIVEFSWKNKMMVWPFLLAMGLFASAGISIALQIESLLIIVLFLLGATFVNFGVLTRRTVITLYGRGGQRAVVFIDPDDREYLLVDLRNKLENQGSN